MRKKSRDSLPSRMVPSFRLVGLQMPPQSWGGKVDPDWIIESSILGGSLEIIWSIRCISWNKFIFFNMSTPRCSIWCHGSSTWLLALFIALRTLLSSAFLILIQEMGSWAYQNHQNENNHQKTKIKNNWSMRTVVETSFTTLDIIQQLVEEWLCNIIGSGMTCVVRHRLKKYYIIYILDTFSILRIEHFDQICLNY